METNSLPRLEARIVADLVRRALEEDRAWEDVSSSLLAAGAMSPSRGRFRVEETLVVAGLPVVEAAFHELHAACEFTAKTPEGEPIPGGEIVAEVHGPARALLGAERVALNFLQRLSAIATKTREAVEAVRGTNASITDTRKTTPGLRHVEKYAVQVGGGVSHRGSLADAVLWKDNHWAILKRIGRPLAWVLQQIPDGLSVIVEVETEAQLEEALEAGVGRILIDNQPPAQVARWVGRAGPDVAIEASGGITPGSARAYAEAGARFISMGSLTHSIRAAAITFEISLDL